MNDQELKELINKPELREGCMVRVLHGGEDDSLHGFQDGKIYRVVDVSPNSSKHYRVTLVNEYGNVGYCGTYQLEVL